MGHNLPPSSPHFVIVLYIGKIDESHIIFSLKQSDELPKLTEELAGPLRQMQVGFEQSDDLYHILTVISEPTSLDLMSV